MLNSRTNKGQVTLFVVLAIVLVAAVVIVYLFAPRISDVFMSEESAQKILASEVEPLKDYVSDCVEETSINFFKTTGMQGGYYDASHLQKIGDYSVVLYKDDEGNYVNKIPSTVSIEGEFSNYMATTGKEDLDTCLDNFKSFQRIMDVKAGTRSITADAETAEGAILVDVTWPITITKAGASTTVEPRNVKLSINLKKILGVAQDIVDYEAQGTNFLIEEIGNPDDYYYNHQETLKDISIDGENNILAPIEGQAAYRLSTIPPIGEEPYLFYFGVDRA